MLPFMRAEDVENQSAQADYSPEGLDLSLIRWCASLTPAERLDFLEDRISDILKNSCPECRRVNSQPASLRLKKVDLSSYWSADLPPTGHRASQPADPLWSSRSACDRRRRAYLRGLASALPADADHRLRSDPRPESGFHHCVKGASS